jgi:hypothetical protein
MISEYFFWFVTILLIIKYLWNVIIIFTVLINIINNLDNVFNDKKPKDLVFRIVAIVLEAVITLILSLLITIIDFKNFFSIYTIRQYLSDTINIKIQLAVYKEYDSLARNYIQSYILNLEKEAKKKAKKEKLKA